LPLDAENFPWAKLHELNQEGMNIYFGVCPRSRCDGKKDAVSQVRALWIDLDAKDFDGSKDKALASLDRLPKALQPSIVIDSGHGYHCYWLLREAFEVPTMEACAEIEAVMKGLAAHLGGDHTSDIGRVLRMPGFLNMKEVTQPVPCAIQKFEPELQFNLSDFDDYALAIDTTGDRASVHLGQFSRTLSERLEAKRDVLLTNDPDATATWEGKRPDLKDQSRSAYTMSMANILVQAGWSDEDIATALACMPSGRRAQATKQWIERTIAKARAWQNQQPRSSPVTTPASTLEATMRAAGVDEETISRAMAQANQRQADPLASIRQALAPLAVEKILKRGTEDAVFVIVERSGREVPIGVTADAYIFTRVRAAIADHTQETIAHHSPRKWEAIAAALIKVAVVEKTITQSEITTEWVRTFLSEAHETIPVATTTDRYKAISHRAGNMRDLYEHKHLVWTIEGGRIAFRLSDLLRHVKAIQGGQIGAQEMARRLKQLGFENERWSARGGKDAKPVNGHFWVAQHDWNAV
jgi:hypothetical protein